VKTLARATDKTEILRRLGALRHDSVRRWGVMSAHQMVCHLTDGCRMLTGERTMLPAPTPMPRPIMKCVALYLPLRWPQGIPTTPELDQGVDGTKPVEFAADVRELARLLDEVANDRHRRFAVSHPVFGRMSGRAWLRWAYLHADHHLRQFGL
jgi:hypothetical protein